MGLYDDLLNLRSQVRARMSVVKGEEATKQALILPFLTLLGFDIYNPLEVQPEFVADFARTRKGPLEKVDYAVHLDGQVAMLIECKACDVVLDDHDAQLARYFNSLPCLRLAVLTNGLIYRYYTDLQAPNVMDSAPFFEFNILEVTERDADLLKPFTKKGFNASAVQTHAEELIYIAQVSALVSELLQRPSESFVRFLLSEIPLIHGRVTQRIVERFVPIVRKSIQTSLLSMMEKSFETASQHVTDAPPPAQAPAPTASTKDEASPPDAASKIVTTERELYLYEAIKSMCRELSEKYPIEYKDTINYMGIHIGRPHSWFIRLVCKSDGDGIVSRLPVPDVQALLPGMPVDAPASMYGTSRVMIGPTDSIQCLRPYILAAYDDIVRRIEKDTGASSS